MIPDQLSPAWADGAAQWLIGGLFTSVYHTFLTVGILVVGVMTLVHYLRKSGRIAKKGESS